MLMRFLRRIQPLFVVLAVILIALLLRSQWQELRSYAWQLSPFWLAVSAGCLAAAWAVEVLIWLRLLRAVGGHLPYWPAVRIWFLSAIVRYIPGNVWQPLSITLLAQRRGVKPEATLTSIVLYQAIILLAVAPIAAVYFAVTGNWGVLTDLVHGAAPWLIAVGLTPLVVFVLQPAWLIEMVNWGLQRLGRARLPIGLTRAALVTVLALAMVDWLIWGAAFAALAFGVNQYSPAAMASLAPHLIAVYPVAYAIGFLSFFTPSGLGVREGALYLLLAPITGGATITLLAVAMRLWTTLGEVIAAGISALIPDRAADPTAELATGQHAPESVGERDLRKGLT
ncbi:lysylphosphatidylglycerol synthase domain-containing protein [Caldilinea sp.]|uniref:lysylphosphatidylglycerol synthase domain-containing protein n=1 Tax=Caldilinea sp. TaxID=2293560 RepID=UPI002BF5709F|nr:flippase-like domain-containing protein [Anaerolineales bacterium]HQY91485.1 lysylphosphatidylglycerol synthase domain-containing protein [Caldilinea sp.]HRA64514.1 lysylphosphatidylglycerol synthase domain-containing protein [Caldilinea sp.]